MTASPSLKKDAPDGRGKHSLNYQRSLPMNNEYMTDRQGRLVPVEAKIAQAAEECRQQIRKPNKPVMDIRAARRIVACSSDNKHIENNR